MHVGSFESVRWNVCVHRLDLSLYSHRKEILGDMESEPMLTPREKSPIPKKKFLRGGSNPRRCIKQDSESNTLPTSYSGPLRNRSGTEQNIKALIAWEREWGVGKGDQELGTVSDHRGHFWRRRGRAHTGLGWWMSRACDDRAPLPDPILSWNWTIIVFKSCRFVSKDNGVHNRIQTKTRSFGLEEMRRGWVDPMIYRTQWLGEVGGNGGGGGGKGGTQGCAEPQ